MVEPVLPFLSTDFVLEPQAVMARAMHRPVAIAANFVIFISHLGWDGGYDGKRRVTTALPEC
ncbi:hypothetical protein GCM10029978_111090 [Actinoallomurus acanthiterrae]